MQPPDLGTDSCPLHLSPGLLSLPPKMLSPLGLAFLLTGPLPGGTAKHLTKAMDTLQPARHGETQETLSILSGGRRALNPSRLSHRGSQVGGPQPLLPLQGLQLHLPLPTPPAPAVSPALTSLERKPPFSDCSLSHQQVPEDTPPAPAAAWPALLPQQPPRWASPWFKGLLCVTLGSSSRLSGPFPGRKERSFPQSHCQIILQNALNLLPANKPIPGHTERTNRIKWEHSKRRHGGSSAAPTTLRPQQCHEVPRPGAGVLGGEEETL